MKSDEALERLPSSGLLSFYDRLRSRIASAVEGRGGRLGASTVDLLLLAPDLFVLLARLALDRRVPQATRSLLVGALAYFILPMDLLPEALLGVGGFVDDLVLASWVLSRAMDEDLEPLVELHWSGSREVRKVVKDVARVGESLLSEGLFTRLKAALARRGVHVEDVENVEN